MCKLSQCDASALYVALLWLMSPPVQPWLQHPNILVWFGSDPPKNLAQSAHFALAWHSLLRLDISCRFAQCDRNSSRSWAGYWGHRHTRGARVPFGINSPISEKTIRGISTVLPKDIPLFSVDVKLFDPELLNNIWLTFGAMYIYKSLNSRCLSTRSNLFSFDFCVLLCFWKLLTLLSSAYTPRGTFLYDF